MTKLTDEKVDQLTQRLTELTDTIKDNNQDPVLDKERITEIGTEIIEQYNKAQAEKAAEQKPVRRIPNIEKVIDAPEGITKSNRYYRQAKDFASQGYSRQMTYKMKPVDLYIAHAMMKAQLLFHSGRMAGPPPPEPSDDLKMALGAGTGDELVPTEMAAQLWDDFFLASRIVAAMVVIPQPTNPFDVPLGLGAVTWRKGSENTATTASDPATAKSTLTSTELVTEQNWSYTLDEDAVVAMAPAIRARLAQSGAEIIDDFALNADSTDAATGNINLDDADPDADSYYLSAGQDGIRHQWLVDNTSQEVDAGGDALADADVTGALTNMGKYAVDISNCVMVVDASTYLNGFLPLSNVTTVDKFGPDAVVRTGQLAAYRGVPIIVSASAPLTEADGKVSTTPGNNTLGQVSIFNTTMWYAGFLRDLLIEVDRDIQKRQFIMVTSLREAVAAHGTRSTNTHTAGIRNILV